MESGDEGGAGDFLGGEVKYGEEEVFILEEEELARSEWQGVME